MLENEPLPAEILTSLDKDFTGWRNWPEDQKKKLLEKLLYDFDLWRLPQQAIPPDNEFRYYINLSGRGGSKLLWVDTPILTSEGFKTMGTISIGDKVYDESGNLCNVIDTSSIQTEQSYKFTFSDHTEVYAHAGHQWVTLTNSEIKKFADQHKKGLRDSAIPDDWADKQSTTTEDIRYTLTHSSRKFSNHYIPLTKPLNNPKVDLPIHPYLLGCWLGDGFKNTASICGIDQEIFDNIEKFGDIPYRLPSSENEKCMVYSFGESYTKKLKDLNLIHNKHIPEIYLNASYEQRLQLLQGLMDTDGSFHPGTKCLVIYSTVLEALADDIYFLICSLGMKASVKAYQGRLNGEDKKMIYRVRFPAQIQVFGISRKANKLHFNHKFSRKNVHRTIRSVERGPILPMRCITVDSPNSLYLVTKSLIATHNTRVSSEEIRKRALAVPNTRINLIAPTHSDCRDTGLEGDSGIISVCRPDEIKKYLKNQGQVIFANGSRLLTFSAQEPERLRGKQSHYCFMDEFCAFEDNMQEILTQVQMSNRLGSDPKIYITTTPKPSKVLEDLIARSDAHVVVSGTLANPFLATPQVKELVERYANTAIGQQELFGQILTEQRGANWTREIIDNNRITPDQVPELIRTIIAVDPSSTNTKRSDECGIMVVGMSADKHFYVIRDLSVKTTPQLWAQRVIQAFHQYHASTVVVEKSDGDLVKTILKNMDHTVPIRMLSHQRKGKTVRAEPVAQLYQQGRVHHVGYHKELENQLCSKVQGDSTSDDRHDALVYACRELSQAGQGGQFVSARTARNNQTRNTRGILSDMKRMQRGF
jgi:phage terminase large subunit-like protein